MAASPGTDLATHLIENAAALRRLARALVGEARADDLVQDTFEAAWKRPPGTDRPLRPWLRAVLVNRARMSARSRGRREVRELAAEAPAPPTSPELALAGLELGRRIAGVVDAIAEPYRQALTLRFLEDRSSEEIARRLDVPSATVRSRIMRGLDLVRAELDRGEPAGAPGGWRLALAPLAAASGVGLPGAVESIVTGGVMVKLVLAVGLVVLAGFVAARRTAPRVAVAAPATAQAAAASAGSAGARAPGPAAGAREPARSPGRLASAAARARLGAAIARARQGTDSGPVRTYDFGRSPVPPGLPGAIAKPAAGKLDKSYIRARIREILPLLRECYELALERQRDLAGTMSLDFLIDAEEDVGGYVREASVAAERSLDDPELAECVTETLLSVELPAPEGGGTVRVVYPLSFEPGPPEGVGAAPG
jgi:RNA polymerase sigma-70 factor (ECF subfamily)